MKQNQDTSSFLAQSALRKCDMDYYNFLLLKLSVDAIGLKHQKTQIMFVLSNAG